MKMKIELLTVKFVPCNGPVSQYYLPWLVNSTATLNILDVCRLLKAIFKRQSRRIVFHGTNNYLLFGKQILGPLKVLARSISKWR